METVMKPTRTILALFVAVLALPMAAVGQDEEASTSVAANDEAIDDIVVVGRKSLAHCVGTSSGRRRNFTRSTTI